MPKTIGKYEILESIGTGAMGVVYRARDPVIDRIVAVKVLSPTLLENASQRERFYQEARTAGNLRHPNIVVIYDCGEDQGTPYIVMEYLEGQDLRDVIAARADWPLTRKLEVIGQICKGLGHAHQKHVVHRDMKPGNIRILPDGSVKIMDFGIARLADSTHTQTGALLGTIAYMSPEQCQSAHVSSRSDIWAVGIILYELLTYRRPFEGDNNIAIVLRIVKQKPAAITQHWPECPPELERIIDRALAKDPKERYDRIRDFERDIENCLLQLDRAGVVPASPPADQPDAPARPGQDQRTSSFIILEAAGCIESGDYEKAAGLIDELAARDMDPAIVSRLRMTLQERIATRELEEPAERAEPFEKDGHGEARPILRVAEVEPGVPMQSLQRDRALEEAAPLAEKTDVKIPDLKIPAAWDRVEPRPPRTELKDRPRVKRTPAWALLAAVLLLAAGYSLYLQPWQKRAAPQSLSLNVLPWAQIVEVTNTGTGQRVDELSGRFTPLQTALPPGDYLIRVTNSTIAKDFSFSVTVTGAAPVEFTRTYPDFDPESLLVEFELQ
jgi:eukaryotic-like serine/threonine-protein kinase